MPNPINTKAEAEKIHELWICHYGYKNAWYLSKRLRLLFRESGRKRKKRKKKKKTQTAGWLDTIGGRRNANKAK